MAKPVALPAARAPSRINLVLGALSLLYPILALVGLRVFSPVWIVGALIALLILRLVLGRGSGAPMAMVLAALGAVTALAITTVLDAQLAVRLYPVFMNVGMLTAFGYSLIQPPTMIERFARLVDPDLTPEGVAYTRKVTWVWVVFLMVNSCVALYTSLFTSIDVWAIYNGGVAYVLMGLLFGGEFIVRRGVRKGHVPPR